MNPDRLYQLAFLAVAAAALVGAALLQDPIEQCRRDEGMDILGRGADPTKDPKIALIQRVPGGLRAPMINYLWIRSQSLKEDGKFFDAKGLRELICEMLPHQAGVWSFLAWDMAWNISVATHTPAERWMWVSNGMELLRDKGIVYNPEELILYRELAWIYLAKCGQYTDEMHNVYKQRWAEEMDWVVGTPPPGETDRAVEAFRAVAEAPPSPEALLADPATAELVRQLAALQVTPGASFLRCYNRLSDDPRVGELDSSPRGPREGDGRDERLVALMRSADAAAARNRLLAFSRRRVLEQTYRLDAKWMLALMEKYGPFDWRHVDSHAMYWATYGLHRARGLALEDIHPGEAEARLEKFKKLAPDDPEIRHLDLAEIERLNTERIILGALKSLTRTGQLLARRYRPRPDQPGVPTVQLTWTPDWRFIEPTNNEYILGGKAQVGDSKDGLADPDKNALANGHVTYLEDVVLQLYFGRRESLARKYFEEIKTLLKPARKIYEGDPSLDEFVRAKIADLGLPPADLARTFWMGALRAAYLSLARGDAKGFSLFRAFALRSHAVYERDVSHAQRLRPAPFFLAEQSLVRTLFLHPDSADAELSLLDKSRLYRAMGNILTGDMQGAVVPMTTAVYGDIQEYLRSQCTQEGINFDLAFPPPLADAGDEGSGGG